MEENTIRSSPDSRSFRPYPFYKEAGLEWLGKIPAHWDITRIKEQFCIVNGSTPSTSDPSFWDGDIVWVTPDDLGELRVSRLGDSNRRITEEGYKSCGTSIVPKGSIVVSTRAPIGYVAIATTNLCTNQGCKSLVPKRLLNNGFFYYQLSSAKFELESRGQGSTFRELSKDKLGQIILAKPSEPEQHAIAAFLDRETAKIDALIKKKERLIELLQENRTALITQAVTKGLDPTVSMKESGVEWLGKIPTHWECLALSRVSFARCDGPFGSGLRSEHYSESGVRVVRLQNIGSAKFSDADRAYINEEYARQLGDHSVLPGDLLIAGLGDDAHPVGRACVAPEHIAPAMVKADCFRFRLDVRLLLARFAAYQLSATAAAAAGSLSTGATRSRLNLTSMTARKVAMPPLREQAAIVSVLDQGCDENYALIGTIQAAINHLREYRTALISAAVTGRIDVREA